MTWRAAKSLLVLQTQLKTAAPQTAPALGIVSVNEWGLIGDTAHSSTSDHTPKDFPGWGSDIVTACDFPNRPDLGLDAHQVLDNIRASRDPRAKYGISNGQMFSSYPSSTGIPAWTWRPYSGTDKHYTHGHLSVVGNSTADGTQPWQIGAPAAAREEDDDMGAPIEINHDGVTSLTITPGPGWIQVCNDTFGTDYALRMWATDGDSGTWRRLDDKHSDADGSVILKSGQRYVCPWPFAATGGALSILRRAIVDGHAVAPTDEHKAYAGHLTCAIQR